MVRTVQTSPQQNFTMSWAAASQIISVQYPTSQTCQSYVARIRLPQQFMFEDCNIWDEGAHPLVPRYWTTNDAHHNPWYIHQASPVQGLQLEGPSLTTTQELNLYNNLSSAPTSTGKLGQCNRTCFTGNRPQSNSLNNHPSQLNALLFRPAISTVLWPLHLLTWSEKQVHSDWEAFTQLLFKLQDIDPTTKVHCCHSEHQCCLQPSANCTFCHQHSIFTSKCTPHD